MAWYLHALLGMFCLSAMLLVVKHVSELGLASSVTLFGIFLFGSGFYAIHVVVTRESFAMTPKILLFILLATVFSYLGNLFNFHAIVTAPNPGYAAAIGATRAIPVAIAAVFLFGSDFSPIKVSGNILTVVGVVLLSLHE